jgi:uncharacterized protein (DUF4213/DUF364 family)
MTILHDAAQLIKERLGDRISRISIERLVIGLFFTGVKLSNGQGGVCFTPVKEIPEAVCCPSSAGRIIDPIKVRGMLVEDFILNIPSHEPIKTAVAIATLNALSATCWAKGVKEHYDIKMNIDAQDVVRMPKETEVAVIGALVPTLRVLKNRGGSWWVIEKDPGTLKGEEIAHYVSPEESDDIIGRVDVLVITGATLVTHTLEKILKAAKPNAEIVVIGPTAGLLPEPLFERGVRVVGGVWVKKPDELLGYYQRVDPDSISSTPSLTESS